MTICRQRAECLYWTWHTPADGDWALHCHTMTGAGAAQRDANTVSGDRDCAGHILTV